MGYGPNGDLSAIHVTTSYQWISMLGGHSPRITIDGRTVELTWGTYGFTVAPGHHEVRVAISRIFERFGSKRIEVDVAPGETVLVWYQAATRMSWATIGAKTVQPAAGVPIVWLPDPAPDS